MLSSEPGNTTQWVETLLYKHQDEIWTPTTHVKSEMWWYMPIIPALGGGDKKDPWGSLITQSSQAVSSKFSERLPLKNLERDKGNKH